MNKYGECGRHPGNNMVNCTVCKSEKRQNIKIMQNQNKITYKDLIPNKTVLVSTWRDFGKEYLVEFVKEKDDEIYIKRLCDGIIPYPYRLYGINQRFEIKPDPDELIDIPHGLYDNLPVMINAYKYFITAVNRKHGVFCYSSTYTLQADIVKNLPKAKRSDIEKYKIQ